MDAPPVRHIKWMSIFESGIEELDAWHRRLVDDCNRLLDLLATGAGWAEIVAATQGLVANCIAHFRFEEDLMEGTGFARLSDHRAAHQEIEKKLIGLVDRAEAVDGSLPEHSSDISSLGIDLIELMIRHDLDYRSHVQDAQGKLSLDNRLPR